MRAPILDGTNYGYWKGRMEGYITAIDTEAWESVMTGWETPTVTDKDGKVTVKQKKDWTPDEVELANWNAKARNAIFAAVSIDQFHLISTCKTAKEAWDILMTMHEGTKLVKKSRIDQIYLRFEKLTMREEETITDLNTKISSLVKEALTLGEEMPRERALRKVLRCLPLRFRAKATAIEESRDLETIRIEELMGTLLAYEIRLE